MIRRPVTLAAAVVTVAALAVPAPALAGAGTTASTTAAETIGAPTAWADGVDGSGVGIALIDTGVSPHPQLQDRVAATIDVSGDGRRTDGHGHGTFLAGLMVGDQDPDGALGVAPGSHLVSVKVADADGHTSLDRVLAGMAVIRETREALGIRVVVLALGGPADDIPDPLEEALEQLWAEGFVVVVASGNDGEDAVSEPGTSPYLITVGAVDDAGTADPADDTLPDWSSRGQGRQGVTKPEILAPGRSVVSVRIAGSSADRENRTSRVDGQWFRGTGTSMSAAVAGGAAALLLDANPDLTPDQVKGGLVASSRSLAGSTAGVIDVPAAIALGSSATANTDLEPIAVPTDPDGDPDTWDGKSWIGTSWSGKSWIAHRWKGTSWSGTSWSGKSWIGTSWSGTSWSGAGWIGTSWTGRSWTASTWR